MNQKELEQQYSKANIRKAIKKALANNLELVDWELCMYAKLEEYFAAAPEKEARFGSWAKLLESILATVLRTGEEQVFQAAVGWLAAELPFDTVWEQVTTAAELLALGQDDRVYVIEKGSRPKLKPLMALEPELYGWINNTQFNLPLIEKPKNVVNNRNCGYHSIKEPVITGGHLKDHDEPVDLDTINILNQVEWCLDTDVLQEVVRLPEGMIGDQAQAFLDAFYITVGELTKAGNKFYFAWQYDTRGRIYSHGWSVNFQSFEYVKALVNPTHEETVTR